MKPSQPLIDLYDSVIFKRVKIHSVEGFFLDGKWSGVNELNFKNNTDLDVPGGIKKLIEKLAHELHIKLFCGLEEESKHLPSLAARQKFMDRLSKVNKSIKTPDPDWQIVETDVYGLSYAEKNGIKRAMLPDTFIPQQDQPGRVSFIRSGESRRKDPCYYYAHSNIYFHDNDEKHCFYWNLKPEGVFILLEALTQSFNFYKIPFQFKCLNHPSLFVQLDVARLFIHKQDLNLVRRLLEPIQRMLLGFLNDEIPLFTTSIDKGLSMSIVPANGQEYGHFMMTRLAHQLVAAALWGEAFEPHKGQRSEAKKKKPGINTRLNAL